MCAADRLLKLTVTEGLMPAIYSSPLRRAIETAEIIAGKIYEKSGNRIQIIKDDRLKERSFGLWEGLSHEEIRERYTEECSKWHEDWIGYRIENGESAQDVFDRCAAFTTDLKKNFNDSEKLLVVSHSGCIRSMTSFILGCNADFSWRFRPDNGKIAVVETDEYGFGFVTAFNI